MGGPEEGEVTGQVDLEGDLVRELIEETLAV